MVKSVYICLLLLLTSCQSEVGQDHSIAEIKVDKVYTEYSILENEYYSFNSVKAINRLADIENEYFQNIDSSVSRFYGTIWRENAEWKMVNDSVSQYQDYLNRLGSIRPDSLHCTLYAYEGLKAGLSEEKLAALEKRHKQVWGEREIAGWSIGYLLVKDFGWKGYLIIDPQSEEYEHCRKSYLRDKSYPVWKQPNIPLEEYYIIGDQDSLIKSLLVQNEFGWGFSRQGIHTWITRFDELKECNWTGPPSRRYGVFEFASPLFIKTKFEHYHDYRSHVIVVPPKEVDR